MDQEPNVPKINFGSSDSGDAPDGAALVSYVTTFTQGGRMTARTADTAATNQALEKHMNNLSELRAKKETHLNTMRNILGHAASDKRSTGHVGPIALPPEDGSPQRLRSTY